MEEKKEGKAGEMTPEKDKVIATPKTRKPRASKSTNIVESTIAIPVAEENQLDPFMEEASSLIELGHQKDKKKKKKKKNKKKEKEKKKAKKTKAKVKKAKKEKAKKAKIKAKAKEKKAKAKAKKAKKNKKNKNKKK